MQADAPLEGTASGHSCFFFFSFHLSSTPPLLWCRHGFQRDLRAGESEELRGVSGGHRCAACLVDPAGSESPSVVMSVVNRAAWLPVAGLLSAKTDHKVVTEVVQDGNDFTWTQSIPNWSWSNKFQVGQECELVTMKGVRFKVSHRNWLLYCPPPSWCCRWASGWGSHLAVLHPQAPVSMEGGKISVQFPQYHFSAEIIDSKLVMVRKPVDLLTSGS